MPQLKVSEINPAIGKRTTDGCHLSRPVLEGHAYDTEFMPQGSAKVARILKRCCELIL
jgi:hypothetical protein